MAATPEQLVRHHLAVAEDLADFAGNLPTLHWVRAAIEALNANKPAEARVWVAMASAGADGNLRTDLERAHDALLSMHPRRHP